MPQRNATIGPTTYIDRRSWITRLISPRERTLSQTRMIGNPMHIRIYMHMHTGKSMNQRYAKFNTRTIGFSSSRNMSIFHLRFQSSNQYEILDSGLCSENKLYSASLRIRLMSSSLRPISARTQRIDMKVSLEFFKYLFLYSSYTKKRQLSLAVAMNQH